MLAVESQFNPFPGLRAFEFHENHLFFGRDGQADELLRHLRSQRFLAVIGASGSGKSSLVRAGLLPNLHGGFMVKAGSAWRVAVCRPGNDPLGNLAKALNEPEVFGSSSGDLVVQLGILEMTLRRSSLGLIEVVQQARMTSGENLLVVVDQFEELFRFKRDAGTERASGEAAAFVRLLLEAAQENTLPIYVVITMRSDYLGDCAEFRDLPETISEGLYLIPRMTRDQRREAIAGPVAVGGGAISPRLVNRLLNDVGDNPDQLPILQHALMRTWDHWSRDHSNAEPLDLRHYEAIGRMAEALSRQADEAFAELPERGKQLAEKLFKRLTEKGRDNREVRRSCTLKELCEVTGTTEAELVPVVEAFRQPGRSFLMPPVVQPLTADSLIDISHESLIRGWGRLHQWVEDEAKSMEIYRRLAQTAELFRQGQAGLWRDPDLRVALDWRARTAPAKAWAVRYHPRFEEAINFLNQSEASRDAEKAERQKQRRIKQWLVRSIIAVLMVACVISWVFRYQALQAERTANEQRTVAQGEALRGRKHNLVYQNTIVQLADRLVDLTAPEEAAFWRGQKAMALSSLGKQAEAITEYQAVLELDPENVNTRFDLAYEYYLLGEQKKALEIVEPCFAKGQHHWVARLNQALSYSLLGNYGEAEKAYQASLREFQIANNEFSESKIAPDIEQATHRKILYVSEEENRTAIYYGIANIKAFRGDDGFETALREAERQPKSSEAALLALQWAWKHLQQRSNDYGGLAAQGALWQRAGLPEWAKKNYQEFVARHRAKADARYTALSNWVNQQLKSLRFVSLPEKREADIDNLSIAARELQFAGDLEGAVEKIELALQREPKNVSLLLQSAGLHYESRSYERVKNDCDAILQVAPRIAQAYQWRALANEGLDADPSVREADLRAALTHNPADGETMIRLSDLVKERDPQEALSLLERSRSAEVSSQSIPYIFWRLAKLQNARGDFEKALRSIETAIAMKDDDPGFYDQWRAANRGLRHSPDGAARELAVFRRKLAAAKSIAGQNSRAFEQYWHALELVAESINTNPSAEAERDATEIITEVSHLLEGAGGSAKTKDFWKAAAESKGLAAVKRLLEGELERLSAAR